MSIRFRKFRNVWCLYYNLTNLPQAYNPNRTWWIKAAKHLIITTLQPAINSYLMSRTFSHHPMLQHFKCESCLRRELLLSFLLLIYLCKWNGSMEYWWKTEVLQDEPIPGPLCVPQIQMEWDHQGSLVKWSACMNCQEHPFVIDIIF